MLTDWSYAGNDGWTRVVWGSLGDGYIMSQFLSGSDPDQAIDAQIGQVKLLLNQAIAILDEMG